jgi:hypothetical protein
MLEFWKRLQAHSAREFVRTQLAACKPGDLGYGFAVEELDDSLDVLGTSKVLVERVFDLVKGVITM